MKNNHPRDLFPAVFGLFLTAEAVAVVLSYCYPFKAVYVLAAIAVLLLGACALLAYFLAVREVIRQLRDQKG